MKYIPQQAVTNKDAVSRWLKIGASVWMAFFVLLSLIFSNAVHFFLYSLAQITGIPGIEQYFVQVREFLLQFFTAKYLF